MTFSDRIPQLAQAAQDAAVHEWSGPPGPRTPMRVFVEQALRALVVDTEGEYITAREPELVGEPETFRGLIGYVRQEDHDAQIAALTADLMGERNLNSRAEAAVDIYRAEIAALQAALRTVYDTFVRDEAQGYRSRDRQFAIEILGRAPRTSPMVGGEPVELKAASSNLPIDVLRDTEAAGVLVSRQDAERLEAERQAILGVVGRYEILAARLCRFGPMPGPITSYHFREAGEELAAITADLLARLRAPALVSPAVPAQGES